MSLSGRHLLDVEDLTSSDIGNLLDRADRMRRSLEESTGSSTELKGRAVALLFAEPSTRTRLSFELAARRLGAETFVLEPISSSMVKGETLVDTVRNLDAIGFSVLVVRHHRAGAAAVAARYFGGSVDKCRRWLARPSDAGAARPVHADPRAGDAGRQEGGDRRRRTPLACREVERLDSDARRS